MIFKSIQSSPLTKIIMLLIILFKSLKFSTYQVPFSHSENIAICELPINCFSPPNVLYKMCKQSSQNYLGDTEIATLSKCILRFQINFQLRNAAQTKYTPVAYTPTVLHQGHANSQSQGPQFFARGPQGADVRQDAFASRAMSEILLERALRLISVVSICTCNRTFHL